MRASQLSRKTIRKPTMMQVQLDQKVKSKLYGPTIGFMVVVVLLMKGLGRTC